MQSKDLITNFRRIPTNYGGEISKLKFVIDLVDELAEISALLVFCISCHILGEGMYATECKPEVIEVYTLTVSKASGSGGDVNSCKAAVLEVIVVGNTGNTVVIYVVLKVYETLTVFFVKFDSYGDVCPFVAVYRSVTRDTCVTSGN